MACGFPSGWRPGCSLEPNRRASDVDASPLSLKHGKYPAEGLAAAPPGGFAWDSSSSD
ncbi:MAG: hypothetical protein QXE79_05980 [Candidatus Bathyarchaeia archaeon]